MWQGLQTITDYKGKRTRELPSDTSLPKEQNYFYARFEANNTETSMRASVVLDDCDHALRSQCDGVGGGHRHQSIEAPGGGTQDPDSINRMVLSQLEHHEGLHLRDYKGILPVLPEVGERALDEGSKGINEQASCGAIKLHKFYNKLECKCQALGSIQNNPKPNKQDMHKLKEIWAMENEHSDLQVHISLTVRCCEKLGHWRVLITGAEEKQIPYFSHREETEDNRDYEDEMDRKRDGLAELCFMLIGEIFKLRGIFKWVWETLIGLVQVAFGKTSNKQIRDTINWVLSENMLVHYINSFRDTFWTDAEHQETKERQNARYGSIKVFNALQETSANKNLLCILLEMFLKELCPELNREMLDQCSS
uniref:Sorting nexin C-terminal domain-containing protein n=1 Tax=Oncorhynchus kisutch TaxID=8019 RepID=A0A8C7DD60_ONCKI